jgi:hypothetical protein
MSAPGGAVPHLAQIITIPVASESISQYEYKGFKGNGEGCGQGYGQMKPTLCGSEHDASIDIDRITSVIARTQQDSGEIPWSPGEGGNS